MSRPSLVLLGALVLFAPRVLAERPESERDSAEQPVLVRLAPTAEQRDHVRYRALEQRLVRLISALPEVEHVEVGIDPPAPTAPLDRPAPTPRVAVVVTVKSEGSPRQTRQSIQHIVSAVLPALVASDLTVVERTRREGRTNASASAHSLVQIGPFLVHPQSASKLRCGLAGLLATNALLAAILLWRTRLVRARTARRTES